MASPAQGPWVVTGAGLVTAAGDEPARIGALVRGPAGEPARTRPIGDFDPSRYLTRKGLRHLSRTSQLACAAAARVAEGLRGVPVDRVGVVLGSAWASLESVVRFEREAHTEGPRFVDPGLFAETVANVPAGHVSIAFGWSALNATVSAGSVSGAQAIATALDFLAERRAAVVVAGGADELNPHALAALAPGAVALGGGEAACLVAIESAEDARSRGARAWGRLRAARTRWTDPASADGVLERATLVDDLLAAAGLRPGGIDLLVVSGAGTGRAADLEAAVLRTVFGETWPAVACLKGHLGETWAASAPLGVVVALERIGLPGSPAVREALVVECAGTGHFGAILVSAAD